MTVRGEFVFFFTLQEKFNTGPAFEKSYVYFIKPVEKIQTNHASIVYTFNRYFIFIHTFNFSFVR
jgi:hypothetical protein